MKTITAGIVWVGIAGAALSLQACALLSLPATTTMMGGAQLAIKGAELQSEIRKADVREAFDAPFEKTWNLSAIALVNLQIDIKRIEKTPNGDGGLIEGLAKKRKIKVIAVEVRENITEIGIWTERDKALADLIAEKIKEEVQKRND
jgi:hypothetical protein